MGAFYTYGSLPSHIHAGPLPPDYAASDSTALEMHHEYYTQQPMHAKDPYIDQYAHQYDLDHLIHPQHMSRSMLSNSYYSRDAFYHEYQRQVNLPTSGYYEQFPAQEVHSPCPDVDEYQRQVSPESTTLSTCSGWSAAGHEDFPSNTRCPFGSPSEIAYRRPHYVDTGAYAVQSPLDGPGDECKGAVNPRDIQNFEDSQDQPIVDVDNRLDFKSEYMAAEEVEIRLPEEREDSGVADVPDIELSHHQSDTEDEEYVPKKRQASSRRRRGSSNSSPKSSPPRRSKNASRASRTTNSSSAESGRKRKRRSSDISKKNQAGRQFPCPLAYYGCTATFATKNEWKRHSATQHVKLEFWRCDLCPPETSENSIIYNDFNRKDLFTQHLRRMHMNKVKGEGKISAKGETLVVEEHTLNDHQERCFRALRPAPARSQCLFCEAVFNGPNGWDERMEHVGTHMQQDSKLGNDIANWRKDDVLEQYLEKQGLIERQDQGWALGSGEPLEYSNEDIADVDAEGEDEEDV